MAAHRNLINLKDAGKGYGSRTVLADVTLGVAAGDRIGIVGRNGDGKSTLLRLIAGLQPPDAGLVTRAGDLDLALLAQGDELDEHPTIRDAL
ncbi:MAG: transport system ATP-binding/permease protein, partial [Solirubrobacteraceae bacterium]|nr:transport system ATP-binding/permease protein [Solirubrobacteraceae bacterium]